MTLLFADLCDSTRIAGQIEPEDYGDLLDRLQFIYERVVAEHGGTVAQISGDGMLATFGYPEPRESDARRAVEAALELRDATRAMAQEERWRALSPRLHSGIHSGRVLLSEGDQVRGRLEPRGRPTNIASRLCGLAGPDEILVSETTLGPERHFFETSPTRQLRLRGADDAMPALSIFGRAPVRSRFAAHRRGGLTPFVGREKELGLLVARLGEIGGGASLAVEIRGPPGEGKTRLAEEFLQYAVGQGCGVYRGGCEPTAEPLHPFLQIARSVFGIGDEATADEAAERVEQRLKEIDPALTGHAGTWLRLLSLSGEDAAPDEAAAAMRSLLAALSRRHPLVLLIDDWHWADDASRRLAGELEPVGRLMVLTTARPVPAGEVRLDDGEVLWLPPLSETETRRVMTRLLATPNPFLTSQIRESSGGNPLFIEELCHAAASGRTSQGPREGTSWLATLVQSRLSGLPEEQADLVRSASIIGTSIPAWLFRRICGRDASDPLVLGLAEQDFIFPGEREGTLRFKHGLTREIVYESVGLHERRAIHQCIAEALLHHRRESEEEPYEALAYHYGAAGDAEATARYSELAGDRALAASALDRAQTHYRGALDALERLGDSSATARHWGEVAHKFARAAVFDPSRDHLPIFERAIEVARRHADRRAHFRAEFWLGYINYALGEPIAAIDHYQRSLALATGLGDRRAIARTRAALGQAKQAACNYAEALPLLDEAIEAERRVANGEGRRIGIAYTLACKGFVMGDMGRFVQAHALYDEAMAAIGGTRRELEASVFDQRSAVCLWQGRMEEALRFAEEGERLGERIRSRYDYAMSRALAGYARWKMRGSPDDVQAIVEATGWLEEAGRNQNISLNYGWLAEAMAESGRTREAWIYAAKARQRARRHDPMGEAMALRAVARLVARRGGRQTPRHYLAQAMASALRRQAPHEMAVTRLCEAELALAAGDRVAAREALSEARRTFVELDMPWFEREANSLDRRLAGQPTQPG